MLLNGDQIDYTEDHFDKSWPTSCDLCLILKSAKTTASFYSFRFGRVSVCLSLKLKSLFYKVHKKVDKGWLDLKNSIFSDIQKLNGAK